MRRKVFRLIPGSREIALIDVPWTKRAGRIRAIESTSSISPTRKRPAVHPNGRFREPALRPETTEMGAEQTSTGQSRLSEMPHVLDGYDFLQHAAIVPHLGPQSAESSRKKRACRAKATGSFP
jgi:hypothetical protein